MWRHVFNNLVKEKIKDILHMNTLALFWAPCYVVYKQGIYHIKWIRHVNILKAMYNLRIYMVFFCFFGCFFLQNHLCIGVLNSRSCTNIIFLCNKECTPNEWTPYLMMKKPKPQNFFLVFRELHMNISFSFLECLVHSSHICKATQRFVGFFKLL